MTAARTHKDLERCSRGSRRRAAPHARLSALPSPHAPLERRPWVPRVPLPRSVARLTRTRQVGGRGLCWCEGAGGCPHGTTFLCAVAMATRASVLMALLALGHAPRSGALDEPPYFCDDVCEAGASAVDGVAFTSFVSVTLVRPFQPDEVLPQCPNGQDFTGFCEESRSLLEPLCASWSNEINCVPGTDVPTTYCGMRCEGPFEGATQTGDVRVVFDDQNDLDSLCQAACGIVEAVCNAGGGACVVVSRS